MGRSPGAVDWSKPARTLLPETTRNPWSRCVSWDPSVGEGKNRGVWAFSRVFASFNVSCL